MSPFPKVSEMILSLKHRLMHQLSAEETDLAIFLRGNEKLYTALVAVIESRIEGRSKIPAPADPLVCKAMMDRDRELQWLLGRLDYLYQSPMAESESDDREQPA